MTKTITRQDIPSLNTYRQGREEYLQKMITYKKERRIKLADHISILFENKKTVLFQILELVNSEDLEDSREIDEYIDIYSGMIPDENELSATLFIELDDQLKLTELLVKLKGIEHHLMLSVGNEVIQAVFEEEHDDREFTTSVHYLKFPLTQTAKNLLLNEAASSLNVTLELNHPNLSAKVSLLPDSISNLQKDFEVQFQVPCTIREMDGTWHLAFNKFVVLNVESCSLVNLLRKKLHMLQVNPSEEVLINNLMI